MYYPQTPPAPYSPLLEGDSYADLKDLFSILSLKRPHESVGELKLITKFIIPTGANRDDHGNWYLRIGDAPVLWSCHTDTVHTFYQDKAPYTQGLAIDEYGFVTAKNSSCLGADNGVGVWLLLQMIAAGKEGLYVFHRQEESGGKGSNYIRHKTPELLSGINFAIAFDRKRTGSIITHQGTRCCSDAFANSLSDLLGMGHKLDDGGTFTDTAHYTSLIPECTNVSAGFYNEHTWQETVDVTYVRKLRDALLLLDTSKLVCERKVTDKDEYPAWLDEYFQQLEARKQRYGLESYEYFDDDDTDEKTYGQEMIEAYPSLVYSILKSWGIIDDIVEELERELR